MLKLRNSSTVYTATYKTPEFRTIRRIIFAKLVSSVMDYRGKVEAIGLIAVLLVWTCGIQPVTSCDREVARIFTRYCSHLKKRSIEPNSGFMGRLRGISGNQLVGLRTGTSDEPQDVLEYDEEPKPEPVVQRKDQNLVQLIDEYLQQDIIASSGLYRRRSRNINPRSRPPRKYVNVLPSALHNCDLAALKEICRNR